MFWILQKVCLAFICFTFKGKPLKNNLKKKSAFGAGLTDVESCIQKLREYSFLSWMDKYTSTRNTKSNIVINKESDKGADSEREEKEDQEDKENENEELSPCITPKVSKKELEKNQSSKNQ